MPVTTGVITLLAEPDESARKHHDERAGQAQPEHQRERLVTPVAPPDIAAPAVVMMGAMNVKLVP